MNKAAGVILKTLILNGLLFFVLFYTFLITAFLLGFADAAGHESDTWAYYCCFVIFHLVINLLFITNPKKHNRYIVLSSVACILISYGIVAYVNR
jgi:cytosine/uracil/thiamine/allantoin permease